MQLTSILKEVESSEFNLTFVKGYGYWDVTKYKYGGDFKRFNGTEKGKLIKGPVKLGNEVQVELNDKRTVVCQFQAVSNYEFDEVSKMAKKAGIYPV